MTDATKWTMVGLLAAGWLALLAGRALDDTEPRRVPLTYTSGQTAQADRASESPTLVALLAGERGEVSAPRRPSKNIFAPLEFPRPKPKKKPVPPPTPPAPPPPAKPAPPPPPSPEELAAERARQYLAQFRVLGYANGGEAPRAFLGRENKIYIAEVGERLEDRIEVAAITEQAVKLRELHTRVEATLAYQKKD